jgi:serine/threonine protein kinase
VIALAGSVRYRYMTLMVVDPSAVTAAEPLARAVGVTAGEMLGKYRLDRVLGAGGMGIVWAAFDPDLERAVALKLLHTSDVPTLRTRLLREARAMARLKHPNVLTVYEVGTDRNRDYIAMEIVDGDTLDVWLGSKPSQTEITEALLAAGRGLAAAHAAGLVHRDFKPHNVLRSNDGHVYVTDFGLARGQIEDGSEVDQVAPGTAHPIDLLVSPLTQTGVMIGTPAYMAPEQFAGRVPDARTDQFAFCVTAWEALTGARPFRGESLPELHEAVDAGVRGLATTLPPRIRDVLARGLEPSPDARWPDLRTLLDALAAASEPPPRRRKLALVLSIAPVLVVGGVALFVSSRSNEDECVPADRAFADAWSDERRDEVLRTNPGSDVLGPLVLLDDLRRRWMRAYTEACAAPRTDATRARLECLLDLRDKVARKTKAYLQPDADIEVAPIIMLSTSVKACIDDRDELPLPPLPPRPPPRSR